MERTQASALAAAWHADDRERDGRPVLLHLRRVARHTPQEMQTVAWLHESLDAGMSEQELLMLGLTTDELRALRLLTLPAIATSDASYLAQIDFIARAGGLAGVLARAVKVADLRDRSRHPRVRPDGWTPPYRQALARLVSAGLVGTEWTAPERMVA
jgi:hypothetical protein